MRSTNPNSQRGVAIRSQFAPWLLALIAACSTLSQAAALGATGSASASSPGEKDTGGASGTQPTRPPTRLPPLVAQFTLEPLPQPSDPPSSSSLTLDELEQMALANNPTLSAALANVRAARGRQIQSGLPPNPKIGYFGMDIGEDDTAGQHGGFVSQEFVTGGKLRLNRAVGGREVEMQESLLEAQRRRIVNDVQLRFYDSLVAQRRVELTEEIASVSGQLAETSQTLLEALQVSRSDLLQAEIEAQETEIFAANARNQRAEAWRRLAAAIGVPDLAMTQLAGNLNDALGEYGWEATYARLMSQSPELSAAEARVQRARLAILRARRENVPNVEVMASASHMTQNGDDVAGVQVGIPLPICNRNQGNILAAEAELVAAQNNSRRLELQLQERLAAAYRRYADARQQVERYQQEILPRAQEALELVGRGYREGQVDFISLLTTQRTYIRSNLAYIEALAELRQATTLIDGMVLSDSLQAE